MHSPSPSIRKRMAAGHVQMAKHRPLAVSRFADGSKGIQPHWVRIAAALLVDFLFVFTVMALVAGTVFPLVGGSTPGTLAVIVLVGLLLPWMLGALCFSGHTPGTLLAGTRLVRLEDGTAPGPWRGGWLMFQRTVLNVFFPLVLLFSLLGDGGPFADWEPWDRSHHVSIDRRRTAALRAKAPAA